MFRILIVDDDEDLLIGLSRLLKHQGYEVKALSDGQNTFVTVDIYNPHLILLDINLCEHDGRDICRNLKSNPITSNIKIILYSGNYDYQDRYREFLADDFIKKPFVNEYLFDRLAFHL